MAVCERISSGTRDDKETAREGAPMMLACRAARKLWLGEHKACDTQSSEIESGAAYSASRQG
jgi:hypothetical protein